MARRVTEARDDARQLCAQLRRGETKGGGCCGDCRVGESRGVDPSSSLGEDQLLDWVGAADEASICEVRDPRCGIRDAGSEVRDAMSGIRYAGSIPGVRCQGFDVRDARCGIRYQWSVGDGGSKNAMSAVK